MCLENCPRPDPEVISRRKMQGKGRTMNQKGETDKSIQIVKILKHVAAIIVAGYPVLILLFMAVQNPDYFCRLAVPDPKNGFIN
jgi:hypothetical protein